ncbi:MAG: class I SAM-dependent methyltransferase [Bacteroidales bacterium]|nr:class I SAM-dependent methyltransferase [Bacteroidales bacterium]
MKENKYDDQHFFDRYSQMDRSVKGLGGAGEWHVLRTMLPDLRGKRVLDLGCGFGWHCRYAVEQGACSVTGVDISEKMLEEAKRRNGSPLIEYRRLPIEDIDLPPFSFDIVLSSLAFHYLESFDIVCRKVYDCLSDGGSFVFSAEHPVFTASGGQDWYYDESGARLHWPVDHYFKEGMRRTVFFGEEVVKYHKTLTTYLNGLIQNGFEITEVREPEPSLELQREVPDMKNELRRPMFLIVSAVKR